MKLKKKKKINTVNRYFLKFKDIILKSNETSMYK
jgi:hypothetical protein